MKAAGWNIKHTPDGKFPFEPVRCINPRRNADKTKTECKCGIAANGNAHCFKGSCFGSMKYDEVVKCLQGQGVKIENLSFGAKPKGNEKRKIVEVKKLDIINGDSELCVEFKKYIEDRGVDPVWFADKYQPVELCLQSLKDGRYGNTYEAEMHYYWEIYPGSYVGRARYDEEYFKKHNRTYMKYDKVKNSDALATPGLVDVVNKQPDILYIVEGYFDALPFPEGTCVPITAQRVIKDDMKEVSDRVYIRKVVYLPDSDVPSNVVWDNWVVLSDLFRSEVSIRDVRKLFLEVDSPKDMGDIFSSMPKADIFARLGLS